MFIEEKRTFFTEAFLKILIETELLKSNKQMSIDLVNQT